MNPLSLKLTDEIAEAMRQRIKAFDVVEMFGGLTFKDIVAGADEKARKIKEDNGTFDVIISTEVVDRAGEVVRQSGWDLTNYKQNPIVLFGHDYYALGIGVCLETYDTTFRGVPALGARGVFYDAGINPLAQQVRKMYDFGIKLGVGAGCTTSVGFIPKDFDQENHNIITRAELLEFSFVPVPANQGVGPAAGRALTLDEAKQLGIDVFAMRAKGLEFSKKESAVGDSCQMDDGTPGILITDPKDPNGPLVCQPQDQDKTATPSGDEPMDESTQKFQKKVVAEHDRHTKAVSGHLEDFRKKATAVIEDQPDVNDEKAEKEPRENVSDEGGDGAPDEGEDTKPVDAKKAVKEYVKSLESALRDEHDMHRAKNVDCFRSYEPDDEKEKAMDREEAYKALRDEHKEYDGKCFKSFDQFKKKMDSVVGDQGDDDEDDHDQHTDWITGELAKHQEKHLKSVTKCAKAICAGFGEAESDGGNEDKGFIDAIIKELGVDEKIGAKLSAATKSKLEEAHGHLMKGIEIVRALHGNLHEENDEGGGDGDGDEPPAEKSVHGASDDKELETFLKTRGLAKLLAGQLNDMLSESRNILRDYHRGK